MSFVLKEVRSDVVSRSSTSLLWALLYIYFPELIDTYIVLEDMPAFQVPWCMFINLLCLFWLLEPCTVSTAAARC